MATAGRLPYGTGRRGLTVLALLGAVAVVLFFRAHHSGQRSGTSFIAGTAMGTTYHIRVLPEAPAGLGSAVRAELERLENIFSTFRRRSAISRFNAFRSTDLFPVPPDLGVVTRFALDLARLTGGAFDPTIAPLVNLWGFGPPGRRRGAPTAAAVERALRMTGYEKLKVYSDRRLAKEDPRLMLDLSSVAKGYAVDRIWDMLRSRGLTNFFVEIGGEVRVSGSCRGRPWRVGVEAPLPDSFPGEDLVKVLRLPGDIAVATSGNYRNFVATPEGHRFGHIIDGRTGFPVSNQVASVTVVAPHCMTADGLATALMVLGPERGGQLVRKFPGAAALFVTDNGVKFRSVYTPGFARYIAGRESVPRGGP